MRSALPRSVRGARSTVPSARPLGSAAAPVSRLKILVAGLDKDARGPVEACVRQAFGSRAISEPWTVSLVKLGARWSVTLHGPSHRSRSVSFTADEDGIAQAIRRAIDADATAPALSLVPTPAVPLPEGPVIVQESHVCEQCRGPLLVAYESRPGEAKELAPVACPHCWQISHVAIGAWAAAGRDYRCEKGPTAVEPR